MIKAADLRSLDTENKATAPPSKTRHWKNHALRIHKMYINIKIRCSMNKGETHTITIVTYNIVYNIVNDHINYDYMRYNIILYNISLLLLLLLSLLFLLLLLLLLFCYCKITSIPWYSKSCWKSHRKSMTVHKKLMEPSLAQAASRQGSCFIIRGRVPVRSDFPPSRASEFQNGTAYWEPSTAMGPRGWPMKKPIINPWRVEKPREKPSPFW